MFVKSNLVDLMINTFSQKISSSNDEIYITISHCFNIQKYRYCRACLENWIVDRLRRY